MPRGSPTQHGGMMFGADRCLLVVAASAGRSIGARGCARGQSGALVVRGEPGVGKTALLRVRARVARRAAGSRARRASSRRWSSRSPACISCARRCWIGSSASRLRSATRSRTAFGLSAGAPPDRFLVGLARARACCPRSAEEQPLVCLVDDAQWLDRASAQALAFVARRLLAESVAHGVRDARAATRASFAGLPELVVEGLRDGDARALLGSAIRGPLDERVRDRIVAETRGNPLALLELPRGLTPAELAGGFGLPDAPRAVGPDRGELPAAARGAARRRPRRLLLVAAAEPVGDPVLLWRAAERLGIGAERGGAGGDGRAARVRRPGAVPASAGALGGLPGGVARGPPARASRAGGGDRPRARSRSPRLAPRAGDAGPDEDVAAELERSAGPGAGARRPRRGGRVPERAAELTPDPARRAQRALAAAQAKHQAGAPDAALDAAGHGGGGTARRAPARPGGPAARARSRSPSNRGSDAPPLLLKAAKRLEPLDAALARETYLDALSAALFAGRLATAAACWRSAQAARAAPPPPTPPRASDLLLDGLALLITEGYAAGAPMLKRALRAFRSEAISTEEEAPLALARLPRRRRSLGRRDLARALGPRTSSSPATPARSPCSRIALNSRRRRAPVRRRARRGRVADRGGRRRSPRRPGAALAPYGALALAAWRGREAEAAALIEATMKEVARPRRGIGLDRHPVGDARCSTTASAATRRRSPRRERPASTGGAAASPTGRSSS